MSMKSGTATDFAKLVAVPNSCGQALVIVLWIMGLLTAMTGAILVQSQHGLRLGAHPYAMLQRRAAADAAVYYALAVVRRDTEQAPPAVDHLEEPWATGTDQDQPLFDEVAAGEARFAIGVSINGVWTPGLIDEERKLNVNTASAFSLSYVLTAAGETAPGAVAEEIVGRRPFFSVEELRLIPGLREEVFDAAAPWLTAHGAGLVNANTAPAEVLQALGCVAEDIIAQRPHAAPPAACPATTFTSTAFTVPIEAWVAPEGGARARWRAIVQRDGRILAWEAVPAS